MVFQNQFSLSLELTRLLPPIKWAADKTVDAIMTRARELSHSGSDIVVEEDLAQVFGRCRISDALTSSFKTIVTKSTSNVPIVEAIMLQGGPGPTVIRAFQDSHYFSMVVQLSFLVWTFPANKLATAIADALRERSEGAPSSSGLQSTPGMMQILGVLRACESQTSAFNWNMMLNAVSTVLGYGTGPAPMDFPAFMLRGLLDMFPMVQTLPNDRFIHIQIPVGRSCQSCQSGTAALIVWAHHVLDLTVLVITHGRHGSLVRNLRFGASDLEQVLIEEIAPDDEASLTILDSHKEHLLTIKPVPEEDVVLIRSMRRALARGWGNTLFSDLFRDCDSPPNGIALIRDMSIVTTAFAFLISKHLSKSTYLGGKRAAEEDPSYTLAYNVNEERLLEASKFLFDSSHILRGEVESVVAQYKSKPLKRDVFIPAFLAASVRADRSLADTKVQWFRVWPLVKKMAVFLIALSHVANLEDCEDLMFSSVDLHHMSEHSVVKQLENWRGETPLYVNDEAWLQALAVPLISHRSHVWDLPWDKICLISDKGWSAWISSLASADPTYISAGSMRIGKGSPCRKGVWKSGIWDVSCEGHIWINNEIAERCAQTASLRCSEKVTLETPYCGEGDDVFLVCARFRLASTSLEQKPIYRTGYKQLQRCLWRAQLSRRCSHGSRSGQEITLGMDTATFTGFGVFESRVDDRIMIHLTAHSIGARWLALATAQEREDFRDPDDGQNGRQIFLRGNDCCFQCTIDQVAAQPGKWFIIL